MGELIELSGLDGSTDKAEIARLRARLDSLAGVVNTLSIETSVLQELCAALMAEVAMQTDAPSERLEQIIADEQHLSYAIASDLDDHDPHDHGMWDMLVDHAQIRNRAFDHARMALARILGSH
jgi:hypothetical protein